MTKALRHLPEDQAVRIATRRLNNGVNSGARGNGFWAAKDFFEKKGMRLPGKLGTQQLLGEALERMANGSNHFSTEGPRDQRHQGDSAPKSNRFGKPPRGEDRAPERKGRRRDKHGMGMPSVRGGVQGVAGRRTPSQRSHQHSNKPRVVRSR